MREGLFDYKTDFFEWDKIEAISHTQENFWDKIFSRGDLLIKLEHGVEYPFEDVIYPKTQAEKIMKFKHQFTPDTLGSSSDPAIKDEKMAIIAEALSEVVKEYMDKKTSVSEEEDY